MVKKCPRCGFVKCADDFYKATRSKDGLAVYCKDCKQKEYLDNKEYVKAYNSKYYELKKEEIKEFRKLNPEKARAPQKKYYDSHIEERRKAAKNYRAYHPEETRDYNKNYYSDNKEYFKKYIKAYRAERPDWVAECLNKRRARTMNAGGEGVTETDWKLLKSEYGNRCAYCNKETILSMDHIIPLSNNGKHSVDNIVPSCRSCNSSKNDTPLLVWMYRRNAA